MSNLTVISYNSEEVYDFQISQMLQNIEMTFLTSSEKVRLQI